MKIIKTLKGLILTTALFVSAALFFGTYQATTRIFDHAISLREAGKMDKAREAYLKVEPLSKQIVAYLERIEKRSAQG